MDPRPSTARKGLPGSQVSRSQVGKKKVPGIKGTTPKNTKQGLEAERELVEVSNAPKKRKRKRETIEPPVFEATGDLADRSCSPTTVLPASKKRKTNAGGPVQNKPAKSKPVVFDLDDDFHDKEPSTRSTQMPQPHSQIDEVDLSEYTKHMWFKISKTVSLPGSRIVLGQGEVTSYNFTQMNWHWIKSLVEKLQPITQVNCSVRGWRETIPYRMGDWNRPDNGDVRLESVISELQKQQKAVGLTAEQYAQISHTLSTLEAKLESWQPLWPHEPLYELIVVRGIFEDPEIVFVKIVSTHGELFIRTNETSKPWTDLVHWIEVQNKNMMGYKSRRYGSQWNGYVITKTGVSQDQELAEQVVEIEGLFSDYSCVAIWRMRLDSPSSGSAKGKRKRMTND